MSAGLEISERFIRAVVVPILRERHGALVERVAVGVHGTGSDVLGLDDEISRDHHWGPRAAVLLPDEAAGAVETVRETLAVRCPPAFEGHPIHHDRANRTGLCVDSVSSYLHWFLGTSRLPEQDEDWFALCETDLLHVTSGRVVHDPEGHWSAIRQRLSAYPERVWKKRVADWCMYVTGRDAPYNLHRVSRRGDAVVSRIYLGQALRRVMELGFAIERSYAPYPKWQYRGFRRLGGCAVKVLPLLDLLAADTGAPAGTASATGETRDGRPAADSGAPIDWRERVDLLIRINWMYAERLHELGLAPAPVRQPFDEGLTDLTLYASAKAIYETLPPAWREISFNQIESWEKLARLVLFDSGDYFQKKFGESRGGDGI